MQEKIMEAHFLREEESILGGHAVRVCDRTAIDPIVYAILTSRDDEEARRKQIHLTLSANFSFQSESDVVTLSRQSFSAV
jgi:hypothetical protein